MKILDKNVCVEMREIMIFVCFVLLREIEVVDMIIGFSMF